MTPVSGLFDRQYSVKWIGSTSKRVPEGGFGFGVVGSGVGDLSIDLFGLLAVRTWMDCIFPTGGVVTP